MLWNISLKLQSCLYYVAANMHVLLNWTTFQKF